MYLCLTAVFTNSCGSLNVGVVHSAELTEQRLSGSKANRYQWLVFQIILSVKELEKSVITSQGHHTVDHLEKEVRRKKQWSTIYIQSRADVRDHS